MGREFVFTQGEREKILITKRFIFLFIGLKKIPTRTWGWGYSWQKYFFPSTRYVEEKNSEKLVNWILKQLKSTGIKVEDNNQYDATSLYLNTKNLDKMHKYLPPMVWLNYSPTTCDDLKDNEVGVEMARVVAEKL